MKANQELAEKGVRVTTLMCRGYAPFEILNVSKEHDLIVMGSRGLGIFKRLLLRSVSGEVVERSIVPVLIAKYR